MISDILDISKEIIKLEKIQEINKIEINRLSDKVYDALKERIINLSLKPGQKLVEMQLADELGVSKSPIRDAFHRLEREKLVSMIPYKGWYVETISMEGFKQICEAREALEIYCLSRSFGSYTETNIQELKGIMESAQKKLAQGNIFAAYQSHREFHTAIIRKFGNTLVECMYSNIWDKLNRYLFIIATAWPTRVNIANQEHFELIKVFENKDVNAAVDTLRIHLSKILEDRFTFQKYWESF